MYTGEKLMQMEVNNTMNSIDYRHQKELIELYRSTWTECRFLDRHLLVGSPGYGKVYVFTQNSLGLYRKSAELTASNYGAESMFGVSIDEEGTGAESLFGLTIDGDGTQAIIGSQYYSLFEGEQSLSYLFSLEGNSWVEKAKFDGGA